MSAKFKKFLSHFGYREWKLVNCELKPNVSYWSYECQVTGKTKFEVELHPYDRTYW